MRTFTNKKGDTWQIYYKNDGRIQYSSKNGEFYKVYNYSTPDYKDEFKRHKFKDGSSLSNQGYYSIKPQDIEKFNVSTRDKMWYITRNKNPKFKNEPVIIVKTIDENGDESIKEVFKQDGTEKVEFQTLEEAKEYFLQEYGIEANFPSLSLAYLTKEAVDDFAKLNYKDKGKRLFEGLKINHEQNKDCFSGARTATMLAYSNRIKDLWQYVDTKKLLNSAQEDEVKLRYNTIFLNTNYNWDNIEDKAQDEYEKAYWSDNDPRYIIRHELSHVLESINSPKSAALNDREAPSIEDIQFIKEVGTHAIAYSYSEFVADYIAGRLAGHTYSKETDEIYQKRNGPKIF